MRFFTAHIAGGEVIQNDDGIVPWWSLTKTALAAAALQLVGQGRFDLDRIIERRYTLRQLLQHTAGVPNYGQIAAYHEAVKKGTQPWSVDELFARVDIDRPAFPPRGGWGYSNVGYLLVRRMIEGATGKDLNGALRHLVFDRLGLTTVRIAARPEDLAATAWGNDRGYHPGWVYHGLLIGSPLDAARFLQGLMTGDLLPPQLLDEMRQAHHIGGALSGRPWLTQNYGLGLMIGEMAGAGHAVGHSGAGPGSIAAVYHFPDRTLPCTVAAFAQSENEAAAEYEVVRLAAKRL